jgi:hypothetical protein
MKPRKKENKEKERKNRKKREPKKSMGRDGGQTVNKTNTSRERKKISRFRNNRISVLVVLELLLQHAVLVLVFKQ